MSKLDALRFVPLILVRMFSVEIYIFLDTYYLNVPVTADPVLYRELDSLPIPNVKLDEFSTTSVVIVLYCIVL